MHLFVCYLNKLQNARCNDKDKKTGLQTRTGGDAEEKTSLRRRHVTISGPTYSHRYDDNRPFLAALITF